MSITVFLPAIFMIAALLAINRYANKKIKESSRMMNSTPKGLVKSIEAHTYYNSVYFNGRYYKFSSTKSAFLAKLMLEDREYEPDSFSGWTEEDERVYNQMLIDEVSVDKEQNNK